MALLLSTFQAKINVPKRKKKEVIEGKETSESPFKGILPPAWWVAPSMATSLRHSGREACKVFPYTEEYAWLRHPTAPTKLDLLTEAREPIPSSSFMKPIVHDLGPPRQPLFRPRNLPAFLPDPPVTGEGSLIKGLISTHPWSADFQQSTWGNSIKNGLLFNKWCNKIGYLYAPGEKTPQNKTKLSQPIFTLHTKINSKWIINLKVKPKSIKPVEGNMKKSLRSEIGKDFTRQKTYKSFFKKR